MPLEKQWKELIKIFIITIIVGVVIYAINYAILLTMPLAFLWTNWLYIVPTLVFLILIYKWAKKYKFI